MSDLVFPLEAQRKYLRIPYKEHGKDFDGCDCGGLLSLVYKTELGIELPDMYEYYSNTHIESFRELAETVEMVINSGYKEILDDLDVKPFDLIIFNVAGNPVHAGIAVNSKVFMHIMEGYTCVRQERLNAYNWRKRIDGIFRWDRE